MNNMDLHSHLVQLERQLHDPVIRCNQDKLADLLHSDFLEFGRSGRSYTFAEIVAMLSSDANDMHASESIHAQDFKLRLLQEGLALLTYKSATMAADGQAAYHALRSSIWQQTARGWQMIFHQGTPTAVFTLNTN